MSGPGVVITGMGPLCRQALSVADLSEPVALGDDWFDPKQHLGKRGFKYLTPATRYILAATYRALEDAGLAETDEAYGTDDRGVFVGTNFAVHKVLEELDEAVLSESSDAISPMMAPSFSLNVAASYVSIKRAFHAFNVSLSSAMVAGIEAIVAGARSLRMGRAKMAIAGATEDRPPRSAASAVGLSELGDGACAFVLEREEAARARGARMYAAVGRSSQIMVPASDGESESLEALVSAALKRVVPEADGPLSFFALDAPFELNTRVVRAIRAAAEGSGLRLEPVRAPGDDGRYASVSAALGAARLAAQGRGLVACTSPQGHLALLELNEVKA